MSNKLAIISGNKDSTRLVSRGYLEKNNLEPIWCDLNIKEVSEAKGKTDIFFLVLPEEDNAMLQQVCFFLRDVCIEEEKSVYVYGSQEMIDVVRLVIPKLFVAGAYLRKEFLISEVIDQIVKGFKSDAQRKKNILLLDDSPDYIQELAILLRDNFNTIILHPDTEGMAKYINDADIIIICINLKMEIIHQAILFDAIRKNRQKKDLKLIFLANEDRDQRSINLLSADNAICLNKNCPAIKIARYLNRSYAGCRFN